MMWIYSIGIIVVVIILFFQSPKGKGIIGEYRVNKVLKKLANTLGGIEFADFMFEDEKSSSQIDNMLLTQKALYVVEVKNYKGMIFGSEENMNWTVTVKHVNKKKSKSGKVYRKTHISKHKFYNPIKQNTTHINKIRNLTDIHKNIPVINIVVFGKNAIIKNVTHSNKTYVLHQSNLKKNILMIEKSISEEISPEIQINIVDTLFYINILDRNRRKKHVKDLKKKYR